MDINIDFDKSYCNIRFGNVCLGELIENEFLSNCQ